MMLSYKLETFEGPLDLLLHLIQKNKVSIYDIPIVLITRQYLEYMQRAEEYNMEISGEFIVMASHLIYIKSKMLLPKPQKEEEDPRAELMDRLIEYQKYKQAIEDLQQRYGMNDGWYYKDPDRIEAAPIVFEEGQFEIAMLYQAFCDIQESMKDKQQPLQKEKIDRIIKRENVSVKSRVSYLETLLKTKKKVTFNSVFSPGDSKACVIATFLAVLELIREGWLLVIFGKEKISLQMR